MDSVTLKGTFQLDNTTQVKDPIVSFANANYDFIAMKVQLVLRFEGTDYDLIRYIDPQTITDTDGLSKAEVKAIVQTYLTGKKQ